MRQKTAAEGRTLRVRRDAAARSRTVAVLISSLLTVIPLLAEGGAAAPGAANPWLQFAPFVLIATMAYFVFVVPQRAKQRRFEQMIAGLKENDHVVTSGGIHGVVTNVQRDAGRLTIRIDDTTGAKLRVSLWAIDSVVGDDPPEKTA
ncbi:preprotein translocase subunit YajC [Botrimarina hoheduenensis]|uniref:Sec translocon accessory complex subunit YajC n=1 Tax=Botrimarina hoheduenensis TaxID=2528000 RepID=A0A5C5WEV1_9BACT|nr:preprotein translocase subunit YajC [Botrimarina hoheduenensis]TWT48282.1 preprotein translocase subunit YajC [Botrimarina hoheduenensis]